MGRAQLRVVGDSGHLLEATIYAVEKHLEEMLGRVSLPDEVRSGLGDLVCMSAGQTLSMPLSVMASAPCGLEWLFDVMLMVRPNGHGTLAEDHWVLDIGHVRRADLARAASYAVKTSVVTDVMCS